MFKFILNEEEKSDLLAFMMVVPLLCYPLIYLQHIAVAVCFFVAYMLFPTSQPSEYSTFQSCCAKVFVGALLVGSCVSLLMVTNPSQLSWAFMNILLCLGYLNLENTAYKWAVIHEETELQLQLIEVEALLAAATAEGI